MLKFVETFNHKKRYVFATVRVSVEEHCVLCEVRNLCQTITSMTLSVSVFVCRCNNDRLHALKLLPIIVSCLFCSWLDARKDQYVQSAGNNC